MGREMVEWRDVLGFRISFYVYLIFSYVMRRRLGAVAGGCLVSAIHSGSLIYIGPPKGGAM